ncbi:restriction endonuclease subunit S [Bacillus zanthoxyli]|nr:restriction endonuclease subunit S [Bacillus zanthoxyli]
MNYKRIGEIVEIYDSLHKTPKTYTDSGYPMVRVKDIEKGFLNLENVAYVDEITYKEFTKKYVPQKQDVILSRVGSYGIPCFVQTNNLFCLGQNTVILHPSKVDPNYLYYCLSSSIVQNQIEKLVTGSTQKTISLKSIKEIEIPFPSLQIQKKIGQFFFNIDNKLNTNKEIIKLLETLSITLFEQWFINFEFPNEQEKPYKSSGGEMMESELGEIPKDWKVYELKEIATLLKNTFNPKNTSEEQVIHFSLPAFDNNQIPVLDMVNEIKSNKWILEDNCVVFSKMNPKTPRVWLPDLNDKFLNIASSEFVVLKSETEKMNAFIYNLCKSNNFTEYLIANATGSTNSRQRITPTNALQFKIALKLGLVDQYGSLTSPLMQKIKNLRREIVSLQEIRETLLPKLLSGEIEMPKELVVN